MLFAKGLLFVIIKALITMNVSSYNIIDVDDILSDNLMPGNLLMLENANASETLGNVEFGEDDLTRGSFDEAFLTMDFHRSKIHEYLCRNFVAEEIISEMSMPKMSRRSGTSALSTKENMMFDEGSKSYKHWLTKSATLEDIYRHYNTDTKRKDDVHEKDDEEEEYDTHVTNYVYEQPAKHTTYNLYGTSGYSLGTYPFGGNLYDHNAYQNYHPSNPNSYGTVAVHSYESTHVPQETSPKYNKEKDLTDLFDIALTALAFLSFGMFIVHVVMCISAVSNHSTTVVTMMPMNMGPTAPEPTGGGMMTPGNGMGGDMTMTGNGGDMTMTGNGGDTGMTMTGNGGDMGMTMTGNGGDTGMTMTGNGGDAGMTMTGNGEDMGMTMTGNGGDGTTGNGGNGEEPTGNGGEEPTGNGGGDMTGGGGSDTTGNGEEPTGNGGEEPTGNGGGDMTGDGGGDTTGNGGAPTGNGGGDATGNGGDGITGNGGDGMTGNGGDGITGRGEAKESIKLNSRKDKLSKADNNAENVRIKDNLHFRFKRDIFSNNQQINELARRVLISIEAALVARDDNGACLRKQLCDNNKHSRSLDNNEKIWIPVWGLGMSWLSGRLIKDVPPATSMLDGLKASILGLGKVNCEIIYKECDLYSQRMKQKFRKKRST